MIYKTDKPKKPAPKPKKQPKPVPPPPVAPMIVDIDPEEWPEGHAPIKDEAEE
jgi:hypothetical protein